MDIKRVGRGRCLTWWVGEGRCHHRSLPQLHRKPEVPLGEQGAELSLGGRVQQLLCGEEVMKGEVGRRF